MKWSKLTDKKPKHEQWVLGIRDSHYQQLCHHVVCQFLAGAEDDQNIYSNVFNVNGEISMNITHWMPLPEFKDK